MQRFTPKRSTTPAMGIIMNIATIPEKLMANMVAISELFSMVR